MSTLGIFLIGLVVTGLVGTAIALLVYGAILDGAINPQADAARSEREGSVLRAAAPAGPSATPAVGSRVEVNELV